MAMAIALVLLVVISILLHFLSPWWLTPIASNWGTIDDTINITFWVTGFVFIAVNLFLAYVVFRYRYNKSRKADYEPENKKLESWLTIFTAVGVAAMLAPGLFVWGQFVNVPEEATEFEALAQQWHWTFRLPGEDGLLGEVESINISEDNPFGINPDDPKGQDDIIVLSNELHLPIDKPVKALLRSKDVLHNFAVPQFRVKMDIVPGMVTYMWFTPEKAGTYEILCEELCGLAHFTMRGHVVVDTEADYQKWLSAQPTFAESQQKSNVDLATGQALYGICAACHGANGEGNLALNAPKLSGQQPWYIKRQLIYYKTGVRGANDQDEYGKQMAAMAATLQDDSAINNVVGYIATLTSTAVSSSIEGDAGRGKTLYQSCSACHGENGEGYFATNAPTLAQQQDWYLKRTLVNFKAGIRGSHPQNLYGQQMILMAKVLRDEESIDDVISYINTF